MLKLRRCFMSVLALDYGELATFIATQIGFGGTLGFLLGYGLKKIAAIVLKIMALVAGLFSLALAWLASIGVISVNFNAFTSIMDSALANVVGTVIGGATFFAQILPISGSFGLGFYLGARKG